MNTTDAIGYEAVAPALARIAELEREARILASRLYHAQLALAIVHPDDTTARLPDGAEIPADDDMWAEAVSLTVRNNSHEYHEILDRLAARAYATQKR